MRGTASVGDTAATRSVRPTRGLAIGFAGLVAATWALIVLGALVRANHAGLACPDWPLCFGEFLPQLDVRVAFEYFHRVLAGSLTLVFLGLGVAAWRQPAVPASTRRLLQVAAVLLGVQILLGAITVWELLASWTVTSHLVAGNAFAVALIWIAADVYESGASARHVARHVPVGPGAKAAVATAALLLAVQVVLGGLVSSRYAGMACPEWPTCSGGLWFPSWQGPVGLHLLHRTNGYLLLGALASAGWWCRGVPRLRSLLWGGVAVGLGQMLVGIANVLLRLPMEVTGLHSALAALLVLGVTLAVREAFRRAAC